MQLHENVVCPFCALACDDLAVEADGPALRVARHGCPVSEPLFALPEGDGTPRIAGSPASLDAAIARAAELLAAARLPLVTGLGTDVAGARAAVALAERAGGVLDHAAAPGLFANLRAMQDGGWITATLAEVRNRADLVVFLGTDGDQVAPRLHERCIAPPASLFTDPAARRLVHVGDGIRPASGGAHLPCPQDRLGEVVGVLQALLDGRELRATAVAGTPVARWRELAEQLAAARYAVLVWAAGALPGPHADLVVGAIAGLLRTLNRTTRAVGLPLAGPDNVIGVNQVVAWQTGVPLRTSLATGAPDHDSSAWTTATLLADGTADLLLWISSFRPEPPPPTDLPTITLVRPAGSLPRPVDVLIPVATPGLDHPGSVYRTDGVVALPVRRLRPSTLPSVAEVLTTLTRNLA